MQLTDITVNMMVSILNDPEEPFTPELEQTATSITGCLTNIIKLAAGSSQDDTDLAVTLPTPEVKITRSVTTTTIVEISSFSIRSLVGVSFSPLIQDRSVLSRIEFTLSEQNGKTNESSRFESRKIFSGLISQKSHRIIYDNQMTEQHSLTFLSVREEGHRKTEQHE